MLLVLQSDDADGQLSKMVMLQARAKNLSKAPLELTLERMQGCDHACLSHRVDPKPVGILNTCGRAVRMPRGRQYGA